MADWTARVRALVPRALAARVEAALAGLPGDQRAAGRTAVSAFALRVAGAAIAYLLQILLARWMGIFEYGIFVVVYVWITILSQIGNLGFSSAVIRFIPEYRARGEIGRLWGVIRTGRLMAMGFSTLLAAIGVAAVLMLPGLVERSYVIPILLGAICLPMFCLTEVQDGVARSFNWVGLAFGPTYIWRPLAILAGIMIARLMDWPMTAKTACLAAIGASWATALIQLALVERRTRRVVEPAPHTYDMRIWLAVSLPILLSDGFYMLLTSVDVVMVSYFGTPDDVAVYYAATKTLALVHFVYYAVRAASGPRFSHHYHAGEPAALVAMVHASVRWSFWPSLAVAIGVMASSELLLSLFGKDFTGGTGVLAILVIGILARASIGPVEMLLSMAGSQTLVAAVFGAALAVNVALNLVLIPLFGLPGAAAATTIAMVVETVLIAAAVRRRFGFRVWVFGLGRPAPARPIAARDPVP